MRQTFAIDTARIFCPRTANETLSPVQQAGATHDIRLAQALHYQATNIVFCAKTMRYHSRLSSCSHWLVVFGLALIFSGCGGGGGSSSGGEPQTPGTEQPPVSDNPGPDNGAENPEPDNTPPDALPGDNDPDNSTPDPDTGDPEPDNPDTNNPNTDNPDHDNPGTPDPGPDPNPATYSIGGTLSGLNSGDALTLQRDATANESAETLNLQANGVFQFSTRLPGNAAYTVHSLSEPSGYRCLPTPVSGSVADADVSIAIHCQAIAYQLSMQVSGLNGSLELNLNQGDEIRAITQNGILTFNANLYAGDFYSLSINQQPDGQTCIPSTDSGIMPANNLTLTIVCNTQHYSLGGTITGLGANPVSLTLNGSETVSTTATTFQFTSTLPYDAQYQVQISSQPPLQRCSIALGSGYIRATISGIQVSCIDISPYAGSYQFNNPSQDPLAPVSFVVSESGQISSRDQAGNVSNTRIEQDSFAYQFNSALGSTDVGEMTVNGNFQSSTVSLQICASDFSICRVFVGEQ